MIKAFGTKNAEVEMSDIAELSLTDLRRIEKGVKIEAFVIYNIAEISNMHIEIVKKEYLYLKDFYFLDISKDECALEVDCFNESDIF